jgi:glutaredoxin
MWNWFRRSSSPGPNVVMYTRQGCHLCEQAWEILQSAQKAYAFRLTQIDVDSDAALAEHYGLQVPVVTVDGHVRFRGQVNAVLLRRLLRARSSNEI